MASSISYPTPFAPFSVTHSRALPNPIFSLRQLNPKPGAASFPFPTQKIKKGLNVRNPLLLPKIQCTRDTKATPISKDLWENLILKSEIPVLVEFYASWCGPCRMVHRIIDEIAAEYVGKLKCFVLNTDTDFQIAEDYEITSVPVVLLFKNGQKCGTVTGTMPKEFYVAAIERMLKP